MAALIRNLPWVISGLILAALLAIGVQIAVTMPPHTFTILTGPEEGGYYQAALAYQKIAKEKGFDLQIRTTNGASETLELLGVDEDEAAEIVEDVRRRDAARFEAQMAGGLQAGRGFMKGNMPQPTPTPLAEPRRPGQASNPEAAAVLAGNRPAE